MNQRFVHLAWKNVWRNRIRSGVVVGAVVSGIWALIVLMAFSNGMIDAYISSSIKRQFSHIQLHHKQWFEEKSPEHYFVRDSMLSHALHRLPAGTEMSDRIISEGMISTAHATRGIRILGIEPEREARVTGFSEWIKEGDFTDFSTRNAVFIGRALAEKMKIGLKSKVVLTFQNATGELVSGSFRVRGIYHLGNKRTEEMMVYVDAENLRSLSGLQEKSAHEMALYLPEIADVDSITSVLKKEFPNLDIQSYKELSPDLEMFRSQVALSGTIMTSIVMLALVFGIINTMLMAILERTREVGMLLAVGMRRAWIYSLIVLETLFLAVVGLPFGMLSAWMTVHWMASTGLDLSSYSDGMEMYGLATIIHPKLDFSFYPIVGFAVVLTALLASIYPAIKASRLKPVEALRL